MLLWGIEPGFDIDNPGRAVKALEKAETVITFSSFATDKLLDMSDVVLPLAPQPESEGSMVNLNGDIHYFKAAARPCDEARPGWKILRKLGGEMGLKGFDQVDLAEVQNDMIAAMENAVQASGEPDLAAPRSGEGLYRIGDVPMYSVDALCRRSGPLQETVQAQNLFLGLNAVDAKRLGLSEGSRARVVQGDQQAEFEVNISDSVPEGGAWLRSATCATRMLGHAVAPIEVEVV
jgi:NADH-quinone oxidoreductase subunit G